MNIDHPQGSGSGNPPLPLTCVWANRPDRHEREDEDLVPEPASPEPSETEDGAKEDENLDPDEPVFLSDDEEPPIAHIEISAREQLKSDFQLRAAKAGMLLAAGLLTLHRPHVSLSAGTPRPR